MVPAEHQTVIRIEQAEVVDGMSRGMDCNELASGQLDLVSVIDFRRWFRGGEIAATPAPFHDRIGEPAMQG